jgi:hypothetical protein
LFDKKPTSINADGFLFIDKQIKGASAINFRGTLNLVLADSSSIIPAFTSLANFKEGLLFFPQKNTRTPSAASLLKALA